MTTSPHRTDSTHALLRSTRRRLAAFTMIKWDKKKQVLEIENYGTEPVRLANFVFEKGLKK